RWGMLQDLERIGVRVRTATRALEITPTGLRVDVDGEVGEIPADTVVLAAGARPYNPLESVLQRKNIPHAVIGDAREIARAMEAVHAGFEAGRDI
ncbi:MAG: NADH:flavin oxidoreductase, partial [Desulfococcaceae bacterium]